MDCKTCKHNFVCKYKEEYIRVKEKSNSEEFKGIFDICCNEYIECEYLDLSSSKIHFEKTECNRPIEKIEEMIQSLRVGYNVDIHTNYGVHNGIITQITNHEIEIKKRYLRGNIDRVFINS